MAKRTGAAVQAENSSPERAKEGKKRVRAVKDAPMAVPVVPGGAEKPYWEEYGACLSDLLAPSWEMTFAGDDVGGADQEEKTLKKFRAKCKKLGIKLPPNIAACSYAKMYHLFDIDTHIAIERIQKVANEAMYHVGSWAGYSYHGEYEDVCDILAAIKGAVAYLLRLSTDLNRRLADIKL